ncbi:aspartate-tRNA ligase [Verruconis gallopava]|uniref:Aspartate-tRNA ligase n=1 Tax=Verruconis gallopava TaxID=253628 RepID=A0A0D2ALL3_9PEZI|nr:aspartate-tRNA ligase [Verruconis gallopava]KIW07390.1 aspartate-tRNA ligase [Verruconis gallopava]
MLFVPSLRPVVKASSTARRSYIELSKLAHSRNNYATSRPTHSLIRFCYRQTSIEHPIKSRRCYSQIGDQAKNDSGKSISAFINSFDFPASTHEITKLSVGDEVVVHGYLGPIFNRSKNLSFVWLYDSNLKHAVQIVSSAPKGKDVTEGSAHQKLRACTQHTPVAIRGIVGSKPPSKDGNADGSSRIQDVEIQLQDIWPLNKFPSDVMMETDTVFGAEQRHLQLRTTPSLRNALRFRSRAAQLCREQLLSKDFIEVETPLLFKSTPEGAREFLVPTRQKGMAYALPQSPQQYKQILMASGIPKYFQIARCFRDEDLRADRQPEFTQLDLEMSFAKGEQVMEVIEQLLVTLWKRLLDHEIPQPIKRMTYHEAMSRYGSDKPDLRLSMELHSVGELLPVDLVSKIGPLARPAVDAMKLSVSDNPQQTKQFIREFMDSPEATPFLTNPEGQPGIFVYDSSQPLNGLFAFGFQTAEYLEEVLSLKDGDLVVIQARENIPFTGGFTPMGRLRLALHKAAVSKQLVPAPAGFNFVWITDFPLFSPSPEPGLGEGQGGTSGLSSTHHPFTSPKSVEDVKLLSTDPRRVVGEHYDIVCNGVELGGGSRRIHSAAMQEYVLREVLGMTEERLADFKHLIDVLRVGCPPHAGIALGFDRLVAVMLGLESVRDVIAFPKSGKGEDLLVKSPTQLTEDHLRMYHLRLDTN